MNNAQVLLDGSIHMFFYVVECWHRFTIDSEDKNYVKKSKHIRKTLQCML